MRSPGDAPATLPKVGALSSSVSSAPILPPRWRVALLLAYGVLVAAKLPAILIRGRFWAEEGNRFFVFAWLLPWRSALLHPYGGYLNLAANVGGLLAWHAMPLAAAPYATSLLALAVQLCPAALLLTSRLAWLHRPHILIVALLLVLVPPISDEVWLSSIGSQVHLSLCAALILALEDRAAAPTALFRLLLLALAALSGPGSWLLLPLFAIRAALERSRPRIVQALVLGAAVAMQLVFFYSHEPDRSYAIHPVLFLDLAFDKHVVLPFLGWHRGAPLMLSIEAHAVSGHPLLWPAVACFCLAAIATVLLAMRPHDAAFWLFTAAVVTVAVSYAGALGAFVALFRLGSAGRYCYTPQVLLSLAMLACAATRPSPLRWAAGLATVWLLIMGVRYYVVPDPLYAVGPAWRNELALHRQDRQHLIRSWPDGWHVFLPKDPMVGELAGVKQGQ